MGMNILIVDDSSVMRSLIIRTIELSGLDTGIIFQASNGREGLDQLEAHHIDLLLVDIHMPVMDGMEMLLKVRSNPRTNHIPVMVISSESDVSRIEKFYELGAEFMHKPFTPEKLKEKIGFVAGSMKL